MRFFIYPQWHRAQARRELRAGRIFLILFTLCILLCIWQWILGNGIAAFLLLIGSFLFLLMKMSMISARDVQASVEIDAEGIRRLAFDGEVLRSTEYRHVRNMEIRSVPITLYTGEKVDRGLFAINYGRKEKLILIYLDAAHCFEDLKLEKLNWSGEGFSLRGNTKESVYLCDQLFYHPNCIALVYDAEAWKLLQSYWKQSEK